MPEFDPEKETSAPKLAEWSDPNVQRIYQILCDESPHKREEEHWEGYCARWIVGAFIEPLRAELHDVSSEADPAGTLRELRQAQDTVRALEKQVEELKAEVERLKG